MACACDRAREWVANSLNYTRPVTLSLFEANIRIVGGLLSAHDLSGDRMFLQRAQELVDFMMPNFYESPLGKVCFLLPSPVNVVVLPSFTSPCFPLPHPFLEQGLELSKGLLLMQGLWHFLLSFSPYIATVCCMFLLQVGFVPFRHFRRIALRCH